MDANRTLAVLALFALGATAAAAPRPVPDPLPPFTVRDLVRLERISDPQASPDGRRIVYTLRTTDMDANKGRTAVWLLDGAKRATPAVRLTDLAANSNSPEWSADGRFVYFLSDRGGSTQVWRVSAGGGSSSHEPPGSDALQVTSLPLDVGSFRVSPKGDRILVSAEVYLDCADLACTQQRLDAAAHSKATGLLYQQLFVRHWDAWADGRRSQVFSMALDDVARGTPVNITAGIGDVPSKPFGGREDYAFSPDGAEKWRFPCAPHGPASPGRPISTSMPPPPTDTARRGI